MTERLEEPTLGVLPLDEEHGYAVTKLDLGFPTIREVVVDRVNANGADDSTAFYGPRAVALEIEVFAAPGITRRQALDKLRAYASPGRRPTLYFDEGEGADERRVRLRGSQLGWPLDHPETTAVQIAFVAPEGVIEAGTETSLTGSATLPAEPGRAYARTYALVYPSISVLGAIEAVNDGTEDAPPILQLWGPCTDPKIENLTTGEGVYFSGLSLTAEQYVEIDVREATVRLNGDPRQSVYAKLDLAATSLFWLRAGSNFIRYGAATFTDEAHAVVSFRSAWL